MVFNMSDNKTGILLLSHGSRLDDGEEVIKAYAKMYKEEFPDNPVEYGFMEIREPNIPQTINKLTSENDLDRIIVVPVFVAHGLQQKETFRNCWELKVIMKKMNIIITTIMAMAMTTDIIITIITTMMMRNSTLTVKSF